MVNTERGMSLVEVMVAMAVMSLTMTAVFGVIFLGRDITIATESRSTIQGNVRLAIDRVERDLRMIGFGVPKGEEVGGSAVWTPAVFHAATTEIGFRTDLDGGQASITCTPLGSNASCPRDKILLESIAYYQSLNCKRPDNAALDLPVVLIHDREAWESATCNGVDTINGAIDLAAVVADATFLGGESDVVTIEQVYFRYIAGVQPPYGRLERYVRYANTPDGTFPPTGATWEVVADHLTDFALEYRDAAGNVLSGNPLSAANRNVVNSVFLFVEGFDTVGPRSAAQTLQVESLVLVRNVAL